MSWGRVADYRWQIWERPWELSWVERETRGCYEWLEMNWSWEIYWSWEFREESVERYSWWVVRERIEIWETMERRGGLNRVRVSVVEGKKKKKLIGQKSLRDPSIWVSGAEGIWFPRQKLMGHLTLQLFFFLSLSWYVWGPDISCVEDKEEKWTNRLV